MFLTNLLGEVPYFHVFDVLCFEDHLAGPGQFYRLNFAAASETAPPTDGGRQKKGR